MMMMILLSNQYCKFVLQALVVKQMLSTQEIDDAGNKKAGKRRRIWSEKKGPYDDTVRSAYKIAVTSYM